MNRGWQYVARKGREEIKIETQYRDHKKINLNIKKNRGLGKAFGFNLIFFFRDSRVLRCNVFN